MRLTLRDFTRAPHSSLHTKVAQGLLQPSTQTVCETKERSAFCLLSFLPQPVQPYLTPGTTRLPPRLPQRLPNTRRPMVNEENLKALNKRHTFQSTLVETPFSSATLFETKSGNHTVPHLLTRGTQTVARGNRTTRKSNIEREKRLFQRIE